MIKNYANFPPFKSDLKKDFGYLSFQCGLINLDLIGIRLKKTWDVLVVFYRGGLKVGWVYDYGELPQETILKIYNDAPENYNDLEAYETKFKDWIEILVPPKDNYVFISEKEVTPYKPKKNDNNTNQEALQDL